ncbi:hypothetical protein LCGC14_2207730, partial [marine sediment metagenome]
MPDVHNELLGEMQRLDDHISLKLDRLSSGNDGGQAAWSKLAQLREKMLKAQKAGKDSEALVHLTTALTVIGKGADEAAVMQEAAGLIAKRIQLHQRLTRINAMDIAGAQSPEALHNKYARVRQLLFTGHSRYAISKVTGLPARTVSRYAAKLRSLGGRQGVDVRGELALFRARFDERRVWLHSKREGCISMFDVTRLAAEETKNDLAEADVMFKCGVLTVIAAQAVNERTL